VSAWVILSLADWASTFVSDRRILKMLMLTCMVGYVMLADYQSNGVQPLFIIIMLGIGLWVGHVLWGDPKEGNSDGHGGD
jgi:hypothetical protein